MAYSVQVTSYPEGAKIFLDGKFQDYTNWWLHGLEGNYVLTLTLTGYPSWYYALSPADAGKTINYNFKTPPTPTTTQIYVTSTPSGARIYGDGVDTGLVTPATWWPKAGYHEITVKLEGYEDMTTTGYFAAGEFVAPATLILKKKVIPFLPRKIKGYVYAEGGILFKAF